MERRFTDARRKEWFRRAWVDGMDGFGLGRRHLNLDSTYSNCLMAQWLTQYDQFMTLDVRCGIQGNNICRSTEVGVKTRRTSEVNPAAIPCSFRGFCGSFG
jgi:hypothetical protein